MQLKEFEGKETAQLVDRYKFLDLYPCSTVELKSIGYSDVSELLLFFNNNISIKYPSPPLQSKGIISNKSVAGAEPVESQSQLPKPDFSQMIPFKPKANAYPGEHPLAGGTFPQPPALASICARLPPPPASEVPLSSWT